jgi:hypothetical protein
MEHARREAGRADLLLDGQESLGEVGVLEVVARRDEEPRSSLGQGAREKVGPVTHLLGRPEDALPKLRAYPRRRRVPAQSGRDRLLGDVCAFGNLSQGDPHAASVP